MYSTVGNYYSFQLTVSCPRWNPSKTTDRHLKRIIIRGHLKCDGISADTRFRLSREKDDSILIGEGRWFIRLLAAEVCASAVIMLDTPCSEVV